eukprot:1537158-Rhodomonas_salina.1
MASCSSCDHLLYDDIAPTRSTIPGISTAYGVATYPDLVPLTAEQHTPPQYRIRRTTIPHLSTGYRMHQKWVEGLGSRVWGRGSRV